MSVVRNSKYSKISIQEVEIIKPPMERSAQVEEIKQNFDSNSHLKFV